MPSSCIAATPSWTAPRLVLKAWTLAEPLLRLRRELRKDIKSSGHWCIDVLIHWLMYWLIASLILIDVWNLNSMQLLLLKSILFDDGMLLWLLNEWDFVKDVMFVIIAALFFVKRFFNIYDCYVYARMWNKCAVLYRTVSPINIRTFMLQTQTFHDVFACLVPLWFPSSSSPFSLLIPTILLVTCGTLPSDNEL